MIKNLPVKCLSVFGPSSRKVVCFSYWISVLAKLNLRTGKNSPHGQQTQIPPWLGCRQHDPGEGTILVWFRSVGIFEFCWECAVGSDTGKDSHHIDMVWRFSGKSSQIQGATPNGIPTPRIYTGLPSQQEESYLDYQWDKIPLHGKVPVILKGWTKQAPHFGANVRKNPMGGGGSRDVIAGD